MFDTVVIATDGSESAERGVGAAIDLAQRFEADVHAVFVVDTDEIASTPEAVRDDVGEALRETGNRAISSVRAQAETVTSPDVAVQSVTTVLLEGSPEQEIISYAKGVDADVIAMGTRGRHGEHAYLLGSVAEAVVRRSPIPVLTVRQLDGGDST